MNETNEIKEIENMAIKTFKRYEEKYLLSDYQYLALCDQLTEYMCPDQHCREGAHYTIYNLYYDTEQNNVIRHSISKPYYKEKLRLRSYKVPHSPEDEVFLELKKKIGGIVCKRRATMTLQEAYDFVESGKVPKVEGYINNQVIQEIAHFLEHNAVTAKVFISYERMAFFGKDNKDFRVTFDRAIQTRRDHLLLEEGAFGEPLLEQGKYLMEVKITGAVPLWLAEVFSDLKIYSASFSKYGKEYKKYCEAQHIETVTDTKHTA